MRPEEDGIASTDFLSTNLALKANQASLYVMITPEMMAGINIVSPAK
jgi:hypothetical protein